MKISELAQATVINGEDVIPVVQGGETKKVNAETLLGKQPDDVTVTEEGKVQLTAKGEAIGDGAQLPKVTVDNVVTKGSTNPVSGEAVEKYVNDNKTAVDAQISCKSTNPVQSKAISSAVANALKGNLSGEIITINDVSPIEHKMTVKVKSKNLFDISQIAGTAQLTNNGDGTITVAANAYSVTTGKKLYELCPGVEIGDVCVLSLTTTSGYANWIYLSNYKKTWNAGTSLTITENILNSEVLVYGMHTSEENYGQETVISDIQIEAGTVATEYAPYIDPSTVKLKTCGKNLFDGEWEVGSINTTTGEKQANSSSIRTVNYIPVKPNTTYYFSFTAGVNYFPYSYDEDFTFIAYKGMKKGSFSLTMGENECYLIIVQYSNLTPPLNAQIEIGAAATEYEEFKGITEYSPTTDGTAENVISVYPTMLLFTDTANTIIECEYNKDTNKVIESLVNAIISLGGNV